MTFDSYTVETDPFLIEMREKIDHLGKDLASAATARCAPTATTGDHIRYDAAFYRWDVAKLAYERALKAAIGL